MGDWSDHVKLNSFVDVKINAGFVYCWCLWSRYIGEECDQDDQWEGTGTSWRSEERKGGMIQD